MGKPILIVGRSGQLAYELRRSLISFCPITAAEYPALDITDRACIQKTLDSVHPSFVINAAAYTDVDRAESETPSAFAVNADGPGMLSAECAARRIGMIHFSTDFVFDGEKREPYLETDRPNPVNRYGASKLRGEENVLSESEASIVFRLAWLYSDRGNNFVVKLRSWMETRDVVRVVDDQVGNPTWSRFVADALAQLLAKGGLDYPEDRLADWAKRYHGVFHLSSAGEASRYDWAQAVLQQAPLSVRRSVRIERARTVDFRTPAVRPAYSALNTDKIQRAFGLRIPDWREQLASALEK